MIELPELATAPVTVPVMVPSVQLKELGTLASRVNAGPVLLQVATAVGVIVGVGLTVTVNKDDVPGHNAMVDFGVTE